MRLRIATLNQEQNQKRWDERRDLILAEIGNLKPDLLALNEISFEAQTGRWLQSAAAGRFGLTYTLIQQPRAGDSTRVEGEGLLTAWPPLETAGLDYRSHNCVAQVVRFAVGDRRLDVYVTHLIAVRVEEAARVRQVSELVDWVESRSDADFAVVCGDFNTTMEQPSIRLMAAHFQPTQNQPTAFTPLQDHGGKPTHPEWERFDRCIDFIWVKGPMKVSASGLCFNGPAAEDPTLWPSDHVGVWADLDFS